MPALTWPHRPFADLQRWRPYGVAAVAGLTAFLSAAAGNTAMVFAFDVLTAVVTLGAARYPQLWLAVAVAFGAGLTPLQTSGMALLPVLVGLFDLASRGLQRLGIAMFVILAAGVVGWGVQFGVVSGLTLAVFFLFCWMAGAIVRRSAVETRLRRELDRTRRRDERLLLARDLHDGIAGSMSHVVLIARELLSRSDLPDAVSAQLRSIATEGRATLVELRAVMATLGDAPEAALPPSSVEGQWLRTEAMLVSCGFDVESQLGEVSPGSEEALRAMVALVRELGANVVRHGDPSGPVRATITDNAGTVNIVVSNRVHTEGPEFPASGTGLEGLRERLEGLGATLTTTRLDDQWLAVARVPARGKPPVPQGRRA